MKITLQTKSVITSHRTTEGAVLDKMDYCEATLNLNGVLIKSHIYLS